MIDRLTYSLSVVSRISCSFGGEVEDFTAKRWSGSLRVAEAKNACRRREISELRSVVVVLRSCLLQSIHGSFVDVLFRRWSSVVPAFLRTEHSALPPHVAEGSSRSPIREKLSDKIPRSNNIE